MNRRNFLRSGGLAVIAAAGLPKAVRSNNQDTPAVTYRMTPDASKPSQIVMEVAVFHKAIDNFSAAADNEKVLTLKVAQFFSTDFTKPASQGEFRYKIKKSEVNKDNSAEYILTTKLDKKVSGDFTFNSDYQKNPKFICSKFNYVEILSKEGYILDTIPYPVSTSGSSTSGQSCFLTTACVGHKQLADDCYELQQLRNLRDNFMLHNTEGIDLVKQYRSVGPSIVRAIDSCDNKADIYDYMYNHMILPATELAAQGKNEEAVDYYKLFVKALAEKYN